MKTKVALVGSSVLSQSMSAYLMSVPNLEIVGFYDDFKKRGEVCAGRPILGDLNRIALDFKEGIFSHLLCGIGYNHLGLRKEIWDRFSNEIPFYTYIHPTVFLGANSDIGAGCFIGPGCIIDHSSRLGPNNYLNPACCISHHCSIGSSNFFSPRVVLAGYCTVGDICFLGVNCTVKDNVNIANSTIIGAGTLVLKDTNSFKTYVGVPADLLNRE